MSLHLPQHLPHVGPELRSLLYALAGVVGLLMLTVGIWWVATYGGGPIPS